MTKVGWIIAIIVIVVILVIAGVALWYFLSSGETSQAEIDAKQAAAKAAAEEVARIAAEQEAAAKAEAAKAEAARLAAAKAEADKAEAARLAAEKSAQDAVIQKVLSETYGFQTAYPESGVCGEMACTYGPVFAMKTADCRALGGRWNGTPADDALTACHLNVGVRPTHGMAPPGTCPMRGIIQAPGATCREMGGVAPAGLADTTWGNCDLSICPIKSSKHVISKIASPDTIGRTYFNAANATQCARVGGTSFNSDPWSRCEVGIRAIPQALLT